MNNNLLLNSTLDEFIEALRQGLGLAAVSEPDKEVDDQTKKHFVYGLKGLASLLGCSVATAARIKKSGTIDAAISQCGKIIVIDADLCIDIMKVKKNKRRI
jgi:hypothetical protein